MSALRSREYPQLYKAGIRNAFFNWKVLLMWAVSAVYQSIILFFFPAIAAVDGQNGYGRMLGIWDVGTMAFTCIVITVNVRLLMACTFVTKWHQYSIFGSILSWFVFAFLYSGFRNKLDRQVVICIENIVFDIHVKCLTLMWLSYVHEQGNIYRVMFILMATWYFWFLVLLVPIASLAIDFLYLG